MLHCMVDNLVTQLLANGPPVRDVIRHQDNFTFIRTIERMHPAVTVERFTRQRFSLFL